MLRMDTTGNSEVPIPTYQVKNNRIIGCLVGLIMFLCDSVIANDNFDKGFVTLNQEISDAPWLPLQLDFTTFFEALKSQPDISQTKIDSWLKRLASLTADTTCQQINQLGLQQHLQLMQQRQALKNQLQEDQQYQGSFFTLNNGKQWYQHWLNSWLFEEARIDELKAMAREELKRVHTLYQQAKNTRFENALPDYRADEQQRIVTAFRQREAKAKQQLQALFAIKKEIPDVNIVPSRLPKSFPAPGIYNPQDQTFIYHLQKQTLHGHHMDWLYIHEGTPGHHLQFIIAHQTPLCPAPSWMPTPMISSEGWAAYVETLGHQLGLFTHPQSYSYALEWRILRALRVLIDIGIHHEGWTETQARTLWMEYLPELPDIFLREYNRIKRWPVQVITYVYGKYLIEQAIKNQQVSQPLKQQQLAAKRNIILRLSNHPPVALNYLSHFLDQFPKTKE